MSQQIIIEEGAFSQTQRDQINQNFSELYNTSLKIPQIAYQTSNLAKTSSVALTALPGLSLNVTQGIYNFTIDIQISSTANGGVTLALQCPSTILTSMTGNKHSYYTGTALTTSRFSASGGGTETLLLQLNAINAFNCTGTMITAHSGTLFLEGAQETSSVDTTTFYQGSYFSLTKIG